MSVLLSIFAALAGLAFGSFLNVCVSRLPRHRSVVAPRSHCPFCLVPIENRDNLPILSWLLLRGRCRHCGIPIPLRYPLLEATTAALFLLCRLEFGLSFRGVAAAVLCWLLLGLAATDAETLLLPDALTLPGIALGVLCSGFQRLGEQFSAAQDFASDPSVPLSATGPDAAFHPKAAAVSMLWAAAAAALILLIRSLYRLLRRREGIGLGDAKLLAMIAAWLGPWETALALFLGTVSAAAWGIFLILSRRRTSGPPQAPTRLPLGAFLSAAGILTLFEGGKILRWYFQFF